jgi:hypothetical protein
VVGEDEHGRVIRRLVAPPSLPVEVPRAATRTEHVAAHHVGARRRDRCDLVGVRVGLLEHPAMQAAVDALAERLVRALVGSGYKPVDRHRHVAGHLAHHMLLSRGREPVPGPCHKEVGDAHAFSTFEREREADRNAWCGGGQ